jgi:hypothetical protein
LVRRGACPTATPVTAVAVVSRRALARVVKVLDMR